MTKKNGILVRGIPIKARWKWMIVGAILLLLFLNIGMHQFIDFMDYEGRNYVSIALIILAIIFSIGSYATESVILAISIFVFISAYYDIGVRDFSALRRKILIVIPIIWVVLLSFGKLGWIHLYKYTKNQFGLSR